MKTQREIDDMMDEARKLYERAKILHERMYEAAREGRYGLMDAIEKEWMETMARANKLHNDSRNAQAIRDFEDVGTHRKEQEATK